MILIDMVIMNVLILNMMETKESTKYKITGTLPNGRRFSPIHTTTPQHYNIWRGTIWKKLSNGKHKRIKTIYN